ncbi:ABC transporter ATP-binding protein [Xylanimonas oleitrophica]|uniref:ABC transporter ATP-binding protein n=1 Tax=Xylanimonas oleitrophica TaxID=2607479 RepID=UPI0015CFABB1|nr:ABC transporter ATP-binding protein [Xylanimonas oleitrophica]
MSADPAPLVEVRGLEAVFATGDGLGPVDLRIEPGEQVLVVGPSGAGKSTLLRCLHGAVPHAVHAEMTGTVAVAGRDVHATGVADLADTVGVVAQDPETGVCLTEVADEVAFPLENLGTAPEQIAGAVRDALDLAGAAHLEGRSTDTLSGGELQRVALAAAVAPRPRLLLLDEPTAMLDGDGVQAVRAAVDRVTRAGTAACVLVEHRLDEYAGPDGTSGLPGRWVVVDRNGRVVHDGPAADVLDRAGADLLAQGCWLPLDAELRVVLGSGDLTSGVVRDGLRALAARAEEQTAPEPEPGPGSEPGAAVLRARGLAVAPIGSPRPTRRRPVTPVLRDVDLELRAGELVAVVGANGGGKSSLLTCLAGVQEPLAGTLEGPRPGLVLQNPEHQLSRTTVREEVAVGLPPGPQTEVLVEEVLRELGLLDHAEHNPFRLSGGQKRRLSLAAVLVHERPFLLADEPTFGLDRHGTVAAARALAGAAAQGRGVMFTCHDLRTVAGYADRVLVVGQGTVLADVGPLDLVRDQRLLAAARLHPPRLVQHLAAEVGGSGELRAVLQGLDDAVAGLARPATAVVPV